MINDGESQQGKKLPLEGERRKYSMVFGPTAPAFSEEIGKQDLRNFNTIKGFQKDTQIIGPR